VAFKNLDDNTSTTVTTATPGRTIDLRYRSTIGRAALGVPVVMKVVATSTAGDTGAINLIDSTGAHMLSCICNLGGTNNYAVSGYLPATLAKYDLEYGGNTLGSLTPLSVNVYEYDAMGITISGALASTIAAVTLGGEGTVGGGINGDLTQTIAAITLAGTGYRDISGDLSQTISAVTLAGTGTVASAETPPVYAGAGTAASGTGALTPGTTPASGNDVEILCVLHTYTSTSDATLSSAQGFTAITGGAVNSGSDGGIRAHCTLFWRRGGGSAPTTTDDGDFNLARIYYFTGCKTSGDPYDTVATTADIDNDTSLTLAGPTTTATNTMVCGFLGAFVQATGASFGSWSNGALSSLTEQDDTAYSVGGEDLHMALVVGTKATTGAVGNTTATISGAGSYIAIAGVVVALKPA
jgi:hypothetical protein